MGTVHIYFSGGGKDGAIESHLNPPDIIEFVVEEGDDYEMYHEYRQLRTEDPDPGIAMRGQTGLWVFTGSKYRDKEVQNEPATQDAAHTDQE